MAFNGQSRKAPAVPSFGLQVPRLDEHHRRPRELEAQRHETAAGLIPANKKRPVSLLRGQTEDVNSTYSSPRLPTTDSRLPLESSLPIPETQVGDVNVFHSFIRPMVLSRSADTK